MAASSFLRDHKPSTKHTSNLTAKRRSPNGGLSLMTGTASIQRCVHSTKYSERYRMLMTSSNTGSRMVQIPRRHRNQSLCRPRRSHRLGFPHRALERPPPKRSDAQHRLYVLDPSSPLPRYITDVVSSEDACYTPASFSTPSELQQKGELFRNRIRTTHWPHRNFWHQERIMRFGKEDPYHRDRPFEEPVETEELLKLAGAMAY